MIRWLTAVLDSPSRDADTFWADVTGSTVSPGHGPAERAVTVRPSYGDAFLRMQVEADGPARAHLDLHVEDLAAETGHMVRRGASVVREDDGLVVLRSPAGLPFCLVPWHGESVWAEAEGRRYRMSLDVPSASFDVDGRFWSRALRRERAMPLTVLMQRVGTGPAGMHLHLVNADRDAEVRRHLERGASLVQLTADRTTLCDPVGRDYCVTDPGW